MDDIHIDPQCGIDGIIQIFGSGLGIVPVMGNVEREKDDEYPVEIGGLEAQQDGTGFCEDNDQQRDKKAFARPEK